MTVPTVSRLLTRTALHHAKRQRFSLQQALEHGSSLRCSSWVARNGFQIPNGLFSDSATRWMSSTNTSNGGDPSRPTNNENHSHDDKPKFEKVIKATWKTPPPRPTIHTTAPSFNVIKVYYQHGVIEHVNLRTPQLVKFAKIHARDLFELNVTSRQERQRRGAGAHVPIRRPVASIQPRTGSIVCSFGTVRAIASREGIVFMDGHSPVVQDFAKEMAELFRSKTIASSLMDPGHLYDGEPVELIFLEEVLRHSTGSFNRRLRLFAPIVNSFLDSVDGDVYSDTGVHQLAPLKDSLQSFEMHVKQCVDCLTSLLNNDEAMLELLITEQARADETGNPVEFSRHQHVELLLGVYARRLNNTLMEIQFLLQRIQTKQEYVTLALAGYRNRVIRMNVMVSIATLSLCIGTTVAGYFGMNVVNGFEASTTTFSTIVLSSTLAGLAVGAGSLHYLSGRTMQAQAAQRLVKMETLSSALSDMCAVDYAIKGSIEQGPSINKDEFRKKLKRARQSGEATNEEVELLFDVLDTVKDGWLDKNDFEYLGLSHHHIDDDCGSRLTGTSSKELNEWAEMKTPSTP